MKKMLKCKFEGCERNFRYPIQQDKSGNLESKILFRLICYHHLHKGNNSSKQLQFVMFKNNLLTICLIKFYYVRLFCV